MGKVIVRKSDRSEKGMVYLHNNFGLGKKKKIMSTFSKKVYFGDYLKEIEELLALPQNSSWELVDEKDA